jgi:hypothetical protein
MDPLNMVYNTALLSVFDVLGITASSVVCMYFRLYVPLSDIQTQPETTCCAGPEKCCNGQFCCEEEYFLQLKSLPCVNDASCRDLGYGEHLFTSF